MNSQTAESIMMLLKSFHLNHPKEFERLIHQLTDYLLKEQPSRNERKNHLRKSL